MTTTLSAPVDEAAPRTAADHIALGLALWTVEGDGCGREELAMRLYRFADDVATGGRLWASTMEYARELAKAGKGRGGSVGRRRPNPARRRGAPASPTRRLHPAFQRRRSCRRA